MNNVVVTYFEPFGGRKENSSQQVAECLKGRYARICLPVNWDEVPNVINSIMDTEPKYIFMLGEAGKYFGITLETTAKNVCNGFDNKGNKKNNNKIVKGGPKEIFTNFDLSINNDFVVSDDAGTFLCNYSYYLALNRAILTRVVFIHLPYTQETGYLSKEYLAMQIDRFIAHVLDSDRGYLVSLDGDMVEVKPDNVIDLYPKLVKEHQYQPIIFHEEINDEEQLLIARVDGFKKRWIEKITEELSFEDARKKIFYDVALFFDDIIRNNKTMHEIWVTTYSIDEYFSMFNSLKRYMSACICNATYNSEENFYRSIHKVEDKLLKQENDEDNIRLAVEYVCRLGLVNSKEILKKLFK